MRCLFSQFEVKGGKTDVKKVKSYNHLGVIIDNKLNWSEHNEMVKNIILKTIDVLDSKRYFSNEKSLYVVFINFL